MWCVFRNSNIFIILCNSLSLLFLMRFLIIFNMFLHCRKVLFCCVIEFCFFPVFRNISWSRISSCIFKDCQSLKTTNEFFINKCNVYGDVTEWVSPVKCLYFCSVDNYVKVFTNVFFSLVQLEVWVVCHPEVVLHMFCDVMMKSV